MKSIRQIRKQIREIRRDVEPTIREQHSSRICRQICEMKPYQVSSRIAAYLAFDGEADPMQLMVTAIDQGKQVFLPIIVEESKPLAFASWTPATPMVKNRFSILEPKVESSEWISAEQLDLVINPLVAFDDQCNRIGVGGGFYDRTFAFLNEPGKTKSVKLIGFAFELQKLQSIQPQEWDIQLDAVVTESHVYR